MLDVFAVAHGFTEVPVRLYTFATRIILFKTNDSIKRAAEKMRDPQSAIAAQQRVNEKANTNPHYFEQVKF